MKEITMQRTITEVTGYKANDGTVFNTKEECQKYEQSAEAAITQMFYDICVKVYDDKDPRFPESTIWENYGYGNEEYNYVVADIKSETELKIANMFSDMYAPRYGQKLSTDYIGKRVLISVGSTYDKSFYIKGTEEELIDEFKKTMKRYFKPEKNKNS